MSKYSLVKLMENEEDGTSKRLVLNSDILITPTGKFTIKDINVALENPEHYKKLFVKIPKSAYEDHFGPSVSPNAKKALEKKRGKPFAPKTPDEIQKFKENYFKLKLTPTPENNNTSLRFSPNDVVSLKQIEDTLNTILTSAGVKYTLKKVTEK